MSSFGNIIVTGNTINNMGINASVINFAKTKNDNASQAAIKSYHKYWIFSLLLWIAFVFVLFAGIIVINKHYKQLNEPNDIKYSEVVTGRIHTKEGSTKEGTINYYKNEFVHFPISEASWLLNTDLKDGERVNVFLDNELKPIYMTKVYNVYGALFIFVSTMIVILVLGIILISGVSAKKFTDYKKWYIYTILPIINNPKFEMSVKNLEYRKLDFSTKNLNTKESKALRKANKTQIVCGIILILLIILYPLINMLFGEYFINGLDVLDYIILIIIVLPFVILGVNADRRAKSLRGIVAKQNYYRTLNIQKIEKEKGK